MLSEYAKLFQVWARNGYSGRREVRGLSVFSPAKQLFGEFEMSSRSKSGPSWLDKVKIRTKKMLGVNVFLCDTCKWDWRGACHHPERPNATWCPDYEKRGK